LFAFHSEEDVLMGKRKQPWPRDGRTDRSPGYHPPGPRRTRRLHAHQVDAAIEAAVASCGVAVGSPAPDLLEPLIAGAEGPESTSHALVDRALGRALTSALTVAWRHGWQPADVHRALARLHGRPHARLAAHAMGCEARSYQPSDVPPRWRMQLDAIGASEFAADDACSGQWVVAEGTARPAGVSVAVETLARLRRLPRLPSLGPAPGEPAPRRSSTSRGPTRVGADPRVLQRVTALLAKAESTTFHAEAEAFTAKAQELMTRHAIDRAAVDAGHGGGTVGGRRVGIDDPYAGPRYLVLSAVAEANRSRAVWSKVWGFATVFGAEDDLDTVELLYTSLMVQATRAMVAGESSPAVTPGAGGIRSFRQSFLVAFAGRIGTRLRQAAEAATADATRGRASLLPVLARRSEDSEAALREAYPTVGRSRVSANDAEGWHAGRAAADRAQLDLHEALHRRAPVR
jgi:hypothetical protein